MITDQGEIAIQLFRTDDGEIEIEKYCLPRDGRTFSRDDTRDIYLQSTLQEQERQKAPFQYIKKKQVKAEPLDYHDGIKLKTYLNQTFEDGAREDIFKTFVQMKEDLPSGDIPRKAPRFEKYDSRARQDAIFSQVVQTIDDLEIREQYAGKKYKPVHLKVKPTLSSLPDQFRIERNIKGDPLAEMPVLTPFPPEYVPTGRYTQERKDKMQEEHMSDGFLWPEEIKCVNHLMNLQNEAFAWDDSERGRFKDEYFPPVEIPVVPHTPWVERNIKIPPGSFDEVCRIIKSKMDNGVYERSNSSYRSKWFCVVKKDGKLRLVHSLEPLNAVTIAHSGIPPATEDLAEQFAGRACGGMFDLYVGYDERMLATSSRDYTTFQTPYGALRLVTLPMGWTNSVPIFHDDVTYILQEEIPRIAAVFIDDVPVKGPATRYELAGGDYERHPANPGIRRFFWEHLQNVNRVLQRIKYSGATFSGKKSTICSAQITVVGHLCTYEGRIPAPDRLAKLEVWPECKDKSDVRAYLGTLGVCRIFIKDFAKVAQPLQKLVRNNVPWEWGEEQTNAQKALFKLLKESPALKPIDYDSPYPVVLAVDTSYIAVGFYIYQEHLQPDGVTVKKHFARFGSITLNATEADFSQPKRELFGLKRALEACMFWLFGCRKLRVETDAKYIKGMLDNAGNMPNATLNRWAEIIKNYHFTLVHVPGKTFGPDGLSRRRFCPGDEVHENAELDYEEAPELIGFENPSGSQLYSYESFCDHIDKRGGYMHTLAKNIYDFEDELRKAREENEMFKQEVRNQVSRGNVNPAQCAFFQQFVLTPIIPDLELKYNPDLQEIYEEDHRTATAKKQDDLLPVIKAWLFDPRVRPAGLDDHAYTKFVRYATHFFLDEEGRFYRKGIESAHKLVVDKAHRMYMLRATHDAVGHRGFFATNALISKRFWWPEMDSDVTWYVKTCKPCQERQKQLIDVPPTITHTPSIFQVIHVDSMQMSPPSNGKEHIAHGRCALTQWMEGVPLAKENTKALARWLFEDVICRWGCLLEIVTDNGGPWLAVAAWLRTKWNYHHIVISPYNKNSNGTIERAHWDVRQALVKACDGDPTKWFWFFHHIMWADRMTVRRRLGCSPFFAVTGAHPTLPLDVVEATWLVKLPGRPLTTEELIGFRARALAKHTQHVEQMRAKVDLNKRKNLIAFEKEHRHTIKDFRFEPGNLVLVRNSEIEASLNKKMKPRYTGPMIVLRRNRGGAYILCEMDGSVLQTKVAAFRVIPYWARHKVALPENLQTLIDVSAETLDKLTEEEETGEADLYKNRDWNFENVKLRIGELEDQENAAEEDLTADLLDGEFDREENDEMSDDGGPEEEPSVPRKSTRIKNKPITK